MQFPQNNNDIQTSPTIPRGYKTLRHKIEFFKILYIQANNILYPNHKSCLYEDNRLPRKCGKVGSVMCKTCPGELKLFGISECHQVVQ